ncbi:PepSY domain-containing protein [Sporomusa sp. KB1]|jgi:uncharacterized iron-regulated membrane protein|uniref:PepSY-associated TM helix domain-containing protein n=1 Tax=Sporomusa sp. KB1 TaxID=943346 RepID=UPI00119F363C|nr:PepSY-associated TM helix domain-containing protein [Sporomusa sp. KB1]TWH47347.1 putative iron-regulated membrane protein [Sporomusa sp. KB1]
MNKLNTNKLFTQSMRKLHTWGGLVFGWLLFAIFLTGTLAVFEPELTHWMKPELRVNETAPIQSLAAADKKLRLFAPQADSWLIHLPQERSPVLEIVWKKGAISLERYLDPLTGKVLKERQSEGGHFFARFHTDLSSGKAGLWLVGLSSVVMLAAILSGIIIHKRVFADFFRLRWRRTWFGAHTLSGVLTLPFVLMITYTGMILTFFFLMPLASQLLYKNQAGLWADAFQFQDRARANTPAALVPLEQLLPLAEEQLGKNAVMLVQVKNPGDRQATVTFIRRIDDRIAVVGDRATFDGATGQLLSTHTNWNPYVYAFRFLAGLHAAKFGGYTISWLYFIAGLASCAMIAAGLIFFTVKRRSRYVDASLATQCGYRAIEALNITVISGLITACTAYLWANRLLPVSLKDRAEAEIILFFSIWLFMLLHALLRPPHQAWTEQLRFAAVLCIGLPFVNALTTNTGLLNTVGGGDWMTAGVDLTAALLGIVMAFTARYVSLRQKNNSYLTPKKLKIKEQIDGVHKSNY